MQTDNTSSIVDVITGAGEWLAAGGILTMALFPFAVPGILLAIAAAVPLVLLAMAVGLLAAVVAAPVVALRAVLRRRAAGRRDAARLGAAAAQPS